MKITAIVPAAGSGQRLGCKTPKPYLRLADKPLLAHTLSALQRSKLINEIIIAAEPQHIQRAKNVVRGFDILKVKAVIAGGCTRSESVRNGLNVLDKDTDFVLIHDAARPFISVDIIDKCIKAAIKNKAAVCAVRCSSTIKSADKLLNVTATLDRNKLWTVQTPQVFSYALLAKAYKKVALKKSGFFDDASLIEQMGHKVKIVEGSDLNIKITTKEDLKIAKLLEQL
ncbi:MAG: 2-C-methyl-D-erythritol 4-phosphate cytidylyltransferase [PVC group bacterium]|nr:2-C-methyl-D-erythritol 4-phosphate cytidylyltransferase [PVC group bacterium]